LTKPSGDEHHISNETRHNVGLSTHEMTLRWELFYNTRLIQKPRGSKTHNFEMQLCPKRYVIGMSKDSPDLIKDVLYGT
jgi:hypothetical protein